MLYVVLLVVLLQDDSLATNQQQLHCIDGSAISHAREPRAELEQRDSEDTIVRLDAYGTMERQEPDDDEDRDADAIASERERCPHRWPPR